MFLLGSVLQDHLCFYLLQTCLRQLGDPLVHQQQLDTPQRGRRPPRHLRVCTLPPVSSDTFNSIHADILGAVDIWEFGFLWCTRYPVGQTIATCMLGHGHTANSSNTADLPLLLVLVGYSLLDSRDRLRLL